MGRRRLGRGRGRVRPDGRVHGPLQGAHRPDEGGPPEQLHALDQGYTYGLLWVAAVAVIVGAVALFIGYTAQQVAHAQEVKEAFEAGDV